MNADIKRLLTTLAARTNVDTHNAAFCPTTGATRAYIESARNGGSGAVGATRGRGALGDLHAAGTPGRP